MTDTKQVMNGLVTESELQGFVTTLARLNGWMAYHTYDSRRSEAGYPDLTLVRGERIIFVELKSEKGKVTQAQERWLVALEQVPCIEVHVWRPSDLDLVTDILR